VHTNFADESAYLMADLFGMKEIIVTCGPLDASMFHGEQCGSCVGVMIYQQQAAIISSVSHLLSVTVSEHCGT
jgi:hypothetical protein